METATKNWVKYCIACETEVATRTNETLCSQCWHDAEGDYE